MFKRNATKEAGGSPIYMAPETLIYNHFSFASDIWALGCILYELCTLQPAFGFVQVNCVSQTKIALCWFLIKKKIFHFSRWTI